MKTLKSDFQAGYDDRINNLYDKYYRYNRADDGAEYDRGQRAAVGSGLCNDGDMHFIEVGEREVFQGASEHNFLLTLATAENLNYTFCC